MSANLQSAGGLLRHWRNRRGVSQLNLASEAQVSARHISFVETGRSSPSREMIVTLSEALEIPLRERNRILDAAGFAPLYRQTSMSDPALSHIRQVIDLILENQHPAGALAVDWSWNLIQANRTMLAITAHFVEPELLASAPLNVMRLVFAPGGLHTHVANWSLVGPLMLDRMRREADHAGRREILDLLEDLSASPSVGRDWERSPLEEPPPLLIPLHLIRGDLELRLFSTITTLGTPQDITLQELRIETFYPMDSASAHVLSRLTS